MIESTRRLRAAALVFALMASAIGARPVNAEPRQLLNPRSPNPVATRLEEAARRLVEDHRYAEAGNALEQAAKLRGWADPKSADLLSNAARVYHAAGDPSSAIRVLLALADQSLANGRVIEAADALIDCSWVAREAGRADAALEAAARALALSGSPLLSPEERSRLRGRLGL